MAWGLNRDGELGDGTTTSRDVRVEVKLPITASVTSARAGCDFTLALTSTGQVLAWGDNGLGQLGNGTTMGSDVPVPVSLPGGTKVTTISAGFAHGLALTSTGKLLAWGANQAGQLGNGRAGGFSSTPVRVKIPAGVKLAAIAAGDDHDVARTSKGKVLAWGAGADGEIGNGRTRATNDLPVRARLPKATRVRGLFAGCQLTVAMTTKGKILAWGRNDHGQLGNGSKARRSSTPARVKLPTGTKITAVTAGCVHALARTSTGHVLALGLQRRRGTRQRHHHQQRDSGPGEAPGGRAAPFAIAAGPESDISLALVPAA